VNIILIELHRTVFVCLANIKHIFVYTYILPYTLLFSFVINSSSSLTCIMAVREFELIEMYSESTYNKMLETTFMVSYIQCVNTKIFVSIPVSVSPMIRTWNVSPCHNHSNSVYMLSCDKQRAVPAIIIRVSVWTPTPACHKTTYKLFRCDVSLL